jgi:hypothetical protein
MKSIPPKDVYKKACEVLKVQPNADTSNIERVYNKESHRKFDITVRIAEKR